MDDVVDRADRTHSLGIKHTESIDRAASSTRFGGCQVFPASITTLTNYPDPSSRCGAAGRAIFFVKPVPPVIEIAPLPISSTYQFARPLEVHPQFLFVYCSFCP